MRNPDEMLCIITTLRLQLLKKAYLKHLMCVSASLRQVPVENVHVHGIPIHILWHIQFLQHKWRTDLKMHTTTIAYTHREQLDQHDQYLIRWKVKHFLCAMNMTTSAVMRGFWWQRQTGIELRWETGKQGLSCNKLKKLPLMCTDKTYSSSMHGALTE